MPDFEDPHVTVRIAAMALSLSCGMLCASPSSAQDQSTVRQVGDTTRETSVATVEQTGQDNDATEAFGGTGEVDLFTGNTLEIAPDGEGIFQKGRDAKARIEQVGRGNAAAITQADQVGDGADGATATILQGSEGAEAIDSQAYLEQRGDRGTMRLIQSGRDNRSYGIQVGNEDGSATPSGQTHTLAGRGHRSEIIQHTTGGEADVTLSEGDESQGFVLQEQRNAKASINMKNGAGSMAEIRQIGEGRASNSDIDVDGGENSVKVVQEGGSGAHSATATQAGSKLSAEFRQERQDDGSDGNIGTVNQKGESNSATVEQSDAGGNSAQIAQEGQTSVDLSATSVQTGTGGANKSDVDQTGTFQVANIEQSGKGGGSVASIDQSTDGTDDNEARIRQRIDADAGTDTADIDQGGSANLARIEQDRASGGTGSNATVTQPGRRGDATIMQTGSGLKAQIDMSGIANLGRIEQAGEGPSAEAAITSGAKTEGNDAEIVQDSGGAIAAIDQTSTRNTARIEQKNPSPSQGTTEADIDQGSGVQNDAQIEQSGPGTGRSSTVTQTGRENKAVVTQKGEGDTIGLTLQITGDFNSVTSDQTAESGNNLTASFKTQGDNNDLTYAQTGDNLGATIEQNGNGNAIEVTQSGSSYDVSITQNGDNNSFSISYEGPTEGGGGYSVVQNGGE
ncbi:hypothetical protein [uncultured Algimonas sp.]|uniref:hypothetical protein n=1 Tax=uncultured Algimonas sp. TaxID=1547920 RepID=UPI00262623ED|nr:hypothetical protein [uncultured Algimonas sp.]